MRARLSVRLALVAAVSVLVAVLVFTFAANALIADRAIDRVDRSLGRTAAQVVDGVLECPITWIRIMPTRHIRMNSVNASRLYKVLYLV